MKIKVYQIDHEKDAWNVMFMDYAFTRKHGGVNPAVYKTVFDGNVDTENLEEVFALLNTDAPVGYNGHSLSVSDIVETEEGFHFCDSFGFKKLESFDVSQAEPITGHRMLVVEPHKEPYEMVIPEGLEPLQQAVGGSLIAHIPSTITPTSFPTTKRSAWGWTETAVFTVRSTPVYSSSQRMTDMAVLLISPTNRWRSTPKCSVNPKTSHPKKCRMTWVSRSSAIKVEFRV